MYKSMRLLALLFVMLMGMTGAALAQTAQDITQDCLFNGAKGSSIKDASYRTVWESTVKNGVHALTVEAPQGQTIGGLLIRWRSWPVALKMEASTADGSWTEVGGCEADFLAQYLPVENLPAVRLMERSTNGRVKLEISSITVLTPGQVPSEVQCWQKPSSRVDMMLLSGHPDDEVLWFGGLLPTYAGEQGREVLVVNAAFARDDRRLELLDSLWTCGVKTYPVFLRYPDVCTNRKERVLQRWNWEQVVDDLTLLYRQHRPDVVVLHDEKGEYGHGVHVVMSEAGRAAAETAADETWHRESAGALGTWDVPKVYLHSYPENQIRMDWHQPLEKFGGLTSFEVADLGFQCHKSQLGGEWAMQIGGPYDNSLFGLWRSTVGLDQAGNDLFENIPLKSEF